MRDWPDAAVPRSRAGETAAADEVRTRRDGLSGDNLAGHMRRGPRRLGVRSRLLVSLVASAAIHAALLAWVSMEVPAPGGGGRLLAGPEREPAPEDPAIEVIRIKPPGLRLPAAAPAGPVVTPAAEATSALVAAGEAVSASPDPAATALAVSVPGRAGPAYLLTFLDVPSSPLPLPVRGESAGATDRPNRGILRRRPESLPFGGPGSVGTQGASGRGLGRGGQISIGIGTDCITAGLARPGGSAGWSLPGMRGGRTTTGGSALGGRSGFGRPR